MSRGKILVVDDDADLRAAVAELLSDAEFEVRQALDGSDALAQLVHYRPDLMVLDAMMPGVDGLQFLALRAKDVALRDIPVIMLTASARLPEEITAAGCALVVQKPVSGRELVAAIESVLAMR